MPDFIPRSGHQHCVNLERRQGGNLINKNNIATIIVELSNNNKIIMTMMIMVE